MSQAIRPTGQHRQFAIGQSVAVREYRGNDTWISGTIVSRTGPVAYQVETTPGAVWRQHIEQLRDAESTFKVTIPEPEIVFLFPYGGSQPSVPTGVEGKKCDSTTQPNEARVKPSASVSSPVRENRYP